jgi:hypothetical protein
MNFGGRDAVKSEQPSVSPAAPAESGSRERLDGLAAT